MSLRSPIFPPGSAGPTGEDERLRQALRWAALGELSCRIAHDSNNLLAGVLGQAELGLLSGDPARMKAALEAILKNSRELKSVNERLLGLSRSVDPAHRNTNLAEVFLDVYRVLERAFTKAGVDVQWRPASSLPPTWCDPGCAMQALLFALRLALESLSAAGGGAAILEGNEQNGDIVLGVWFTGPGQRSPDVPEAAGALTVPLAGELLRNQGGSFHLERDGEAWRVKCRFPVRKPPHAVAERPSPVPERTHAAQENATRSPLSVLVVEDEAPIRELVKEVLEAAGCRVEAVVDGETALARFRRGSYTIVMTDIALPGLDGVALVRRMRAVDPDAVLVVLTGRATDDAVMEARTAGASVVLGKPFELSDLIAIVTSVRDHPAGSGNAAAPECPSNLLVH